MRASGISAALAAAALVLGIFIAVGTVAEEKKPPEKKEVVTIDGDQWKWRGGEDNSVYTITGNVLIKHSDATITADKAEYNEKTRVVSVAGSLKIVDERNIITGTRGTVYLNDKKSIVNGDVKVVVVPKRESSPKPDQNSIVDKVKEPATITCDLMEYLYGKKIATFDGNFRLVQKTRVLVANKATYDSNQELATLVGGVKITDDDGQSFSSQGTVRASLKEGAEWIEADKASATLNVKIDEELDDSSESE